MLEKSESREALLAPRTQSAQFSDGEDACGRATGEGAETHSNRALLVLMRAIRCIVQLFG